MTQAAGLVLVLGFITLPATAAPHCSQKTTRGTWVYACEGYLPPAPGAPIVPARLLGTCNASETGFWSCVGSLNVGGLFVVQQGQTMQGQAHNNDDCTGTVDYSVMVPGVPESHLNIQYVIFDDGDRISGLPLDSGGVLSCALQRTKNVVGD